MGKRWIWTVLLLGVEGCAVPPVYSVSQAAAPEVALAGGKAAALTPLDPERHAVWELPEFPGAPADPVSAGAARFRAGLQRELQGDPTGARLQYQAAVDAGSACAALRQAGLWIQGLGGPRSYRASIPLLEQAAAGQLVPAYVLLGDSYLFGRGVIRHPERAFTYYIQAAKHKDPYAQYMISILYRLGIGVPSNLEASVDWYFQAEQQSGSAEAQYRIGRNYALGRGFKPDVAEAVRWWKRAADQHALPAVLALAQVYRTGSPEIPRDPAKAIERFYEAYRMGSAEAEYYLGLMYYNGDGVPRDAVSAATWFLKAAEHGFSPAQYQMGQLFQDGEGVPQSDEKAFAWWTVSAGSRVEGEKIPQIERLVARMDPPAQRRALAFAREYRRRFTLPNGYPAPLGTQGTR